MITRQRHQAAILVLVGFLATPAFAIEFRAGQNVTIAENEVIDDDLYVTGEVVAIHGTVRGDVVAMGREIVFDGAALGDFFAAGQGVVVNGSVADDVRIAGMALQLGEAAAIGDDVIAAGLSLEAVAGGVIAGSVVFSGFQALLAADVYERVLGEMAGLRIEGRIRQGGEVRVEGEGSTPEFMQFIPSPVSLPTVAPGLSVASNAIIEGELVYTSPSQARGDEEGDNLVHIAVERSEAEAGFGERAIRTGKRWAAIAVVGLLFLLAGPGWLSGRAQELSERIQRVVGWGIGGFLILPIAVFLGLAIWILALVLLNLIGLDPVTGLVAVGGIVLALALVFLLWLAAGFIAQGIVALWLGRGLSNRFFSSGGSSGRGILPFLAGCLLLGVVALVPFIGGLVGFVSALLGFGAMVAWLLRPLLRLFQ